MTLHESDRPAALLARLDAIGRALEASGHGMALLGLGSVGLELERLDAYSDLDFFAIVEAGHKGRYIDNLDWLTAAPIAYAFRNTADGYKLLYEDGIFCEFAVFEPHELAQIPFAAGRIVWQRPGFDERLAVPARTAPEPGSSSDEWLVGEAVTNLYVGLCRYRRGEKLSAARFIQQYAVDRVLDLAPRMEPAQPGYVDGFTPERRFEQRFPLTAAALPSMVQGYERSPQSALAILAFLETHFPVNAAMAARVRELAEEKAT
ncbi:MAG: hypothetical protein KDD75_02480 [Caldilineaceae bacterium]|nr:hypothetical protein [Caldilineaceae bacterium]